MTTSQFETKTKELIDGLKKTCATYGLGNDGNEFKIITQAFLYKFMNDKFAHEMQQLDVLLRKAPHWEEKLATYSDDDVEMLHLQLLENTARLERHHLIRSLFGHQNDNDFAQRFDETLIDIAILNADIFSVQTDGGTKITLFDRLSLFIADPSKRNAFCRAIINQLVTFSFEPIFAEKYDFFATIFEYLISDYNKDGGGKYAEYYTPHAVARIMAAILVTEERDNIRCYDPSAGSGTLLMNLAHAVGEERCTIYSQDISQKSSSLLRLNLILNNLVASIPNVVQGNTILSPAHRAADRSLLKYDYVVANPPFKLDFSDFVEDLDVPENNERFFAGLPNVPKKKKDGMAIYPLFVQHIMHVLKENGRAAIVLPTGFLTAQGGADKKIRKKLVESKMVSGVVSMPSNIFATTGTNVSILFLDRANDGKVLLMDASNLGTKVKEGKNQKTVLSMKEEDRITETFNAREAVEDFTVAVTYEELKKKNYSFSAGQYFEVKIEYSEITAGEFAEKIEGYNQALTTLFQESTDVKSAILENMSRLKLNQA
ncbi:HsdM family class I SAM-dependent methyltransferase [Neolewinella antarctica]|uniref:site-specific DNA-methyltransferase (adenine-specific) n=1 Tax=Neolewinella antarctica TaxID=442734 RepID=A0ABX0X969_9BACT|nr:class I SAM-dependent DNA methyltransferase [Neolewinella antarctica]NJC25808.1 type I restriction enzyme M protein [Neolewinella antarctica]